MANPDLDWTGIAKWTDGKVGSAYALHIPFEAHFGTTITSVGKVYPTPAWVRATYDEDSDELVVSGVPSIDGDFSMALTVTTAEGTTTLGDPAGGAGIAISRADTQPIEAGTDPSGCKTFQIEPSEKLAVCRFVGDAWVPDDDLTFENTDLADTVMVIARLHGTDVGAKPAITTTAPTTVAIGETYSYEPEASGSPRWTLVSGPTGMTVHPATGEVSWRPTEDGAFSATIMAFNHAGYDTEVVVITVAITDPVITSLPDEAGLIVEPGEFFHYNEVTHDKVTATGSPRLVFTGEISPANATFHVNSVTGLISFHPVTEDTYTITITVDNGGTPDTQTFDVTVITPS